MKLLKTFNKIILTLLALPFLLFGVVVLAISIFLLFIGGELEFNEE